MVEPLSLEFVQRMSLQELVRGLADSSLGSEEIARIGNEVRRRVLDDLTSVHQEATGCPDPEFLIDVSDDVAPYASTKII
jgi:hypothetical protein